jgi:hypothetical protein
MTIIGAGGVKITAWRGSTRFHKEYVRLEIVMRDRVDTRLRMLLQSPLAPGLGFEKLKGYSNPDIYTIHATGNYKISFEIENGIAYLRRVAPHDEIDRAP